MKSFLRKISLLFVVTLFAGGLFAQPVWVPTTPSIGTTGPTTIPVNYGIDRVGTVYIAIVNFNDPTIYSSAIIKNAASTPLGGAKVAAAVIPITAGNINTVLQIILGVVNANRAHTVYIAADGPNNVFVSLNAVRLVATTKACPPIKLTTILANSGECVNQGSEGLFFAQPIPLTPTGILKGTTWTVTWGDGSPNYTYTSAFDDDIPPIQFHTYTNITDCNYVGTFTIQNPCMEFSNGSSVLVVHGRDIPADGDGNLLIQEKITGTPNIIFVCEGTETNITLRDASTWNCQNPVVPIPLIAKPNLDPRTLQWTYGENPAGAVGANNTISGDVFISGVQATNAANGYVGPVFPGQTAVGLESEVITIPATSVVGQRYFVHLKNWNKCNPFVVENLDYETQQFIIEIIDAPPAPIVVTPQTYCFGSVPVTISATPNLGTNTLNWYSDAGLTTLLSSGLNLTHAKTAVGTYNFWVTETSGVNGCEGPAAQITMIINPIPNKPNISVTGPATFCYDAGTTSVTLTASPVTPPVVSAYQWYKGGVALNTAVSNTFNQVNESGSYTLRVYGIAPSSCPSPLSDPTVVTIHPLATTTNPLPASVCAGSSTSFTITAGGAASSIGWQRSADGGGTWANITNATNPNDGGTYSNFTTATLGIANAQNSMNNYRYRARLTTSTGSCVTISNNALLTVNAVANITTQPVNTSVCELSNTTITAAANVGLPSTITGYLWQRQIGAAAWTNITGALDGSVYSGFNTATLTITGATAGIDAYKYRLQITTTGGCTVNSNTATLTVNQLADITAQPANSGICAGSSTTFVCTDDGNPAVATRQWQVSINNGVSWNNLANGGIYSGVTSNTLTLTNVTIAYNNYQYRVILNTAGPCPITSNAAILNVHVNPIDRVVSAADSWLCYNTGTNINLTAAENGTVYQLRTGVTNVGGTQNGTGANLSFATGNLTASTTFNIYAARTTTQGASTRTCNLQMTNTPLVSVNPNLTITNLTHPNVCLDGSIDLPQAVPGGGSGTYTYSWTGTGGYTNNVQNPAAFVPLSTGAHSYDVTVRDEGFRTASADNTICTVADNIAFTVNPLPVNKVIAPAASPICYNASTNISIPVSEAGIRYDVYKTVGNVFVGSANGNGGTVTVNTGALTANTSFYAVAVNTTTSCDIILNTVTVNVNPQFSLAQLMDNASICSNTATNINVVLTGGTSPYTINYTRNGAAQPALTPYISGTNQNTGNLLANTTYALTSVTDAAGCSPTSLGTSILITVGSLPTNATLTGSGDACVGATSTLRSVVTGGAPPYTLVITGAPATPYAGYISNTNIALGALAVGPHSYTLTGVTDFCGNSVPGIGLPAGAYTITINGIPDASGTFNNTPVICNDAALNISLNSTINNSVFDYTVASVPAAGYSWTVGKEPIAGSITDGDGNGTETFTRTLRHDHTSPVSVTYTITPKGPGVTACPGAAITRTIIVEPTPVITSPNKTICDNTSTAITVSTSTTTSNTTYYTWTVSAVGANITGASNGPATGTLLTSPISQTLDNTGTTAQTVTYNITPRTGTAPGTLLCSGTAITVVVTVEPTPVITSPNKTICDNTSTAITVSSSSTTSNTTYYTWTVSGVGANITGASNGPATGTLLSSPIAQTLDNTGTSAQTVTYNITPRTGTAPGSLLCSGTPIAVVVTVEPTPVISSPNKTICDNTSTAITVGTSTTTSNSTYYTWTVSAVGANITGSSNGPATGTLLTSPISQTLDNTGTTAQTVTYNITPRTGTAPGTLLCSGTPITVVVTVEPTPVITSPNKTICDNTSTAITVSSATVTSNIRYYTWTVSGIGASITGASDGPATGALLTSPLAQTLDNTGTTAQTVTYNITPWTGTAPGALLCAGTPIAVVVTVEPTPVISSPNKTICDNTSTAISVSSSTTTSNTTYYTWTVSAVGANITGASNGPATGTLLTSPISQTLDNTGTTAQTVTYNITPRTGTAPGTLLCSGTPITVVVTVEPTPVITSPNKTICDNTSTAITVSSATATSNIRYYTWTVSGIGANITGASSGPATGTLLTSPLAQTLDNTGTTAQTVTYNITPWTGTAPASLLCAGTPIAVVVTVEPTPVISAIDKTICDNTSSALTINTSTTTNNTTYYTWTVSAVGANITGASNGPANGTPIGTALSQTLNNTGSTVQTVTYIITPRTGTAPGALLCAGTSISALITIEPTPVISSPNLAVCDGGTANLTVSTTTTTSNTTYYRWTVSGVGANITGASSGPLTGTLLSSPISQTLNNSSTSVQTVTYNITPWTGTAPGSLLCSGATINVIVTVNPTPKLSSSLTPPDICSSTAFSYIPTSLTPVTTFSWSRGVVAGIDNPANTGTNNPNEILVNKTSGTLNVTYVYTLTANTCPNVQNVVVAVKPEPVITDQTASVCSGNALNHEIILANFANPGDNVTFTWPLPSMDAGLTGATARVAPSNANITDVFSNTSGLALSATYAVRANYNGCLSTIKNIVVTVGAEPVLDPGLNRFACSRDNIELILKEATGSVVPTGYNISLVSVQAGLVADLGNVVLPANNAPASFLQTNKYNNETGLNRNVTYRVTPLFGAVCIGLPVDVVITIRPQPVIVPGQVKTVCSNVAVNKEIILLPANTPAGTLFNWGLPLMSDGSTQGSVGVNVTADPLLKNHITDILVNYSLAPITATYTVTPESSFGCEGIPRDVVITVNPEPAVPVIAGRDKLCRGETNIVYSVPPIGGSSYTWTVPGSVGTKTFDFNTNAIIINAALLGGSGNISVVERNSFNCPSPAGLFAVQVYDPSPVSAITGDNEVCAMSTSVYSVPENAGSVYLWSLPAGAVIVGDPSSDSVTITFATFSGNLSVRETNAAGCVTNHTPLLVTVTALPTATLSNGGTICMEGTRPLNIAFTGNGPWSFVYAYNGADSASINAPVSPHTLTVNQQGSYTITSVTDSKACVNTGTGNATVNFFPKPTGTISGTAAICAGNTTTITVSLTGPAPYNFTYFDGTTSVNVNNHPSGTYTFTVSPLVTTTYTLTALTDNNSCLGLLSGSAVITVNARPLLSLIGTNLLCNGDNTGSIALIATGNTPFAFAWTGPDAYSSGSEDITGLKAGIYNLTVTDVNSCTSTASHTITEPAILQLANSGNISLLCNAQTSGAGSFTASGGTAPYTFFTVSNTTGGTVAAPVASSINFSNAGAGAITMRVTDANGCQVTSVVTISQPVALNLTSILSTSIEGSHNINCNGANTGTIGLSVTGGVSPYVYSWTTVGGSGLVAGAANQNALTAGSYTATITDANGCIITGNYILTHPTVLVVTASTDDNIIGTCPTSVANLNATITGGVELGGGGYIYSWSPAAGLSAANIPNPVAKPAATTTYTLTVTDANGCSKVSSVLITVNPALTAVATTTDNLIGTCPTSSAQLDVNVNGGEDFGAGLYLYSWSPAAGLSNTTIRNPIAKPAVSTTYTVTVTDNNGCSTVSNVTVNVAPALSAVATTDDALIGTCPASDAQLNLTVSGGETAYTYLWNNAGSLSNATIINPTAKPLVSTTYTATITDANNCTTTAPVLVSVAPDLTAVATASDLIIGTCPTSVSNLDVTVAGGEAAYTYKWLPSTGLDDSNIKNPVAKPALTTLYTVTVTDANLCTTTSSITVTVQPALGVSSTADDYVISTCPTSVANISSVVSGGEAGYTYSWVPAAGLSAINIPNPIAKPVITTTYTLTVTDANGCSASGNITITVQPALSATASASDLIISTCPTSTSTLNAIVSGGEPGYTYSWLPVAGLSDPSIQNPVAKPVATTNYTLTATDVNGCSTTASITITVQPPLVATATTDDNIIGTCPTSLANLDVTVAGGEAAYTYSWAPVVGLNNPFIKTPIAKPAVTTTYTVTVTDANGCSTTSDILITVNPALTVTTGTSDTHIGTCPGSVANLTATAVGGELAYSYSWLPVSGLSNALINNPVAKPAVTTTYTVTVTDANGCTATSNITITVRPDLAATAIASDYNIGTCPTSTSTLDVNVTGGETNYTYSWAPAASLLSANTLKNPVAKPAVTTTYTVTVTDNNGCTTTADVTITVLPALTAIATASDMLIGTCPTSTSNLDVTAAGGEAGYTYSWAPIAGLSDPTLKNPIAKPAVTTLYTVTVTDVNGCQTTASVTVTVAPVLTVTATANDLLISTCATSVSNLLATSAGGEMPLGGYLYSWSPSAGLSDATISNPVAKPGSTTTYSVTITDQNGCTAVSSITVNVAPVLSAIATASDPLIGTCPGSTSTLDVNVTGGEAGYSFSWIPAADLDDANIKSPVAKPAVTTLYTVTVTDVNGCSTTANVTVTVAPALTATAAATDALISTCATSVSQLSVTVNGGEPGYTYLWNNAGTLNNATIPNPVAKPAVTTIYTVTVTDVNGCQTTANVTVNVAPPLAPVASSSDYILSSCPSSIANLNVVTTGGEELPSGGYIYSWTPIIGLNYANVQNPIAKPAATTTYTITVTDFNGCTATSQVIIQVRPPLALSFTTFKYAGGYDISCFGASDGEIDLTVAGGEAPFTYNWSGPSTFTSLNEDNVGLIAGTYNVTVTDVNGCTVSTSVILIEPVVLNLSKSANFVLPCFGDASGTGSFSVSGGTGPYTFTVAENTAGATVIPVSPTSQSFSGAAAGRVVMLVNDANGCSDQDTIFITQPAVLTPGSVSGSQEVCYLGDPSVLNEVGPPTDGPGSYLYQWENSAAFAGPFGNVPGANLSSYDPPSGISSTTYYRRRVNSGSCTPVYSNIVTVTVNPLPVAVISGDATICPATNTPLKVNITTGTSPYTVNINNGVGSVAGYISNTNINVNPSVYTEYTLISVTDAKGCVSTAPSVNLTGVAKITIHPDIIITQQPANSITCEGTNTTFTTLATGVGLNYKWQIETTPGTFVNVNDLAGVYSGTATATLTIINPLSALNGKKYRAVVTDLCSRTATTIQATLSINEKPEVTVNPTSLIVCEGSNITFTVNAGVTASPAYQWQEFDGVSWTNILNGGNYLGANSSVLNVFNVNAGMSLHQYKAIISGTCTPQAESLAATLTVNTAPQITLNPRDTTVCEFLPAVFKVLATGTSLDYQWQVDMNDGGGYRNLADTVAIYTGTTSATLNVLNPARRFNNYKYRAQVTGTCNPTKTSAFAVLTVHTAPEMVVQPVSQTICEYNSVGFSVNISGANINYIWQENSGGVFVDLQDTASYIGTKTSTMNIFNVPRAMSSNRYRVIATGMCNPPVVSAEAILTVNTSPAITASPVDVNICENGSTVLSVTAEGSGLTYQWQVSTGGAYSNVTNDTSYAGVNTANLNINDAEAIFNGYKYRVRVSGTCVPPANSAEATLFVNANPIITSHPSDAVICEDGNISFIGAAIGPNLTYQWQVSINNGGTWSNITDNSNYSGSTTPTLTVLNGPVTFNNNLYRLSVSSACTAINGNSARLTVNANPVVNITGSGLFPLVCGNTEMIINGNPSGGSGTYLTHSWTGDVTPLNSFNTPQTTFKTIINGSYNLTYTVTDNKTCKASQTVVVINDMPNAQFTSTALPSCGFLMVDFTNTSTRATSYEWNFDDGTPVETGLNASHGFENLDPSGTVKYYEVQLKAFSANGCEATTNQYITIYPKIDPSFTITPESACQPVVATMITQPGAANYAWDFGDGQQISGGYAVLHEYVNTTNATISYVVTLETTSFYGCKALATDTIDVFPLPTPNFSVAPINQTYPEATINITNLVVPGPWSYTYYFDDGSSSTDENPVHTYALPGTYKIVQVVSASGCSDSISQTVVISPAPPIAAFTQPESGCTPLEIQFVNNSQYGTSYRWDFGDGSISTKENPTYTYFDAGTFPITLTVTGPGGSSTVKTTLEVFATPILNFSYTPDSVYINDKPVKFFNLSGYANSYSWNFGDYDEDSGAEAEDNTSTEFEPIHVYHTKGWKDVTLIGSNAHCSDTLLREHAVYVSPAGKFIFPNVFRPNPTGPIDEHWDKNNPDIVNRLFFPGVIESVLEYHLYIYNRWGEQVFATDDITVGWNGYIKGEIAKQGVYIWKVTGKYTNGKNFMEAGDVTLLY